jgi:hypothetical protein
MYCILNIHSSDTSTSLHHKKMFPCSIRKRQTTEGSIAIQRPSSWSWLNAGRHSPRIQLKDFVSLVQLSQTQKHMVLCLSFRYECGFSLHLTHVNLIKRQINSKYLHTHINSIEMGWNKKVEWFIQNFILGQFLPASSKHYRHKYEYLIQFLCNFEHCLWITFYRNSTTDIFNPLPCPA